MDILRDAIPVCHLRGQKGDIGEENQNTMSGGTNTVWVTLPSTSWDLLLTSASS